MKLSADRLAAAARKSLGNLYVLCGDEPLLADESLEVLREAARAGGCDERQVFVADRGFDWDAFGSGLQNLSLFARRRLVELRLPGGKPGDAGARFLAGLAANPDTGNVIVILLPALDYQAQKAKWVTALAGAAAWVDLKAPSREELPAWLARRLQKSGLTADEDSLDLLAARVEGNLLAAKQEIDKLALLAPGGRVTAEAIRDTVADGARFDVFQLADAVLARDTGRAMRVLAGLEREAEAPVLVLWALARDALALADLVTRVAQGVDPEQAMFDARIWRSRQQQFRGAARGRTLREVGRLVRCVARADQVAKGVRPGDPWIALRELTLEFCGAGVPLAETA
jgi:DNA polymerase-3 subunit delta